MNIQDSFNAMLGSVAVLGRLSPMYDVTMGKNLMKAGQKAGSSEITLEGAKKIASVSPSKKNTAILEKELAKLDKKNTGFIQTPGQKATRDAVSQSREEDMAKSMGVSVEQLHKIVAENEQDKAEFYGQRSIDSLNSEANTKRNINQSVKKDRKEFLSTKAANKAIDDAFKNAFKDNDGGKN